MPEHNVVRRVIEVNGPIIGPATPRLRQFTPRKLSDFAGLSPAYCDIITKLSSPLRMGPPVCEECVAFVRHLFAEDEADVVRHLGFMQGKTEASLVKLTGKSVDEIRPVLHRLAFEKRAIVCSGPDTHRKYKLLPVMPGIFEMVLIGESLDALSDWHRRFIELFEALYDTGYSLDYMERRNPLVRFLSVGKAIEGHPMALPSDWLEVVLDRYKVFGVGQCQCRMSAAALGNGCGRSLGNCTGMGEFAEMGIRHGWLKSISKKALIDIKAEAEADGMATWILNVESTKGQYSCSCCGCCCKAMRLVNQFNAPSLMAPPHFVPKCDLALCTFCGKCALKCPMGALSVDRVAKTFDRRVERCIGCGLCAMACQKSHAIRMEPIPDHQLPYRSWFSMLLQTTPSRLWTAWKVWRKYK